MHIKVDVHVSPKSGSEVGKKYNNGASHHYICGHLCPHFFCHVIGTIKKRKVNHINEKDIQINDKIRDPEVRVIDPNGEVLGIMSSREAYNKACELELDLVKISPNANPPVCKIIDFGKFRYELLKKEKESKKNQRQAELKEIRMTPNIDTNDLNTKINAGRKFLEKGHKLKVTLRFRGREMAHMMDAEHILTDYAATLNDIASIEKPAKAEGRMMSLVLTPKK